MNINRREAIQRAVLLMGGIAFAPNLAGILNMEVRAAAAGAGWVPRHFSPDEARLVSEIAEVILPAGNTPGAGELGVPAFIEQMVHECYSRENRDRFTEGLKQFDARSRERHGAAFANLDPAQKVEFARDQNRDALEGAHPAPPFFLIIKELAILGYFTSEAGATQVLRYDPVPGRYEGCIPFSEVGKTWAT